MFKREAQNFERFYKLYPNKVGYYLHPKKFHFQKITFRKNDCLFHLSSMLNDLLRVCITPLKIYYSFPGGVFIILANFPL